MSCTFNKKFPRVLNLSVSLFSGMFGVVVAAVLGVMVTAGCDRSGKPASDGPQYSERPAPPTTQAAFTFCVVPALTPTKVVLRYQPLHRPAARSTKKNRISRICNWSSRATMMISRSA